MKMTLKNIACRSPNALLMIALVVSVMYNENEKPLEIDTPVDPPATAQSPVQVTDDPALVYLASMNPEEINCLALNIYFESRGESYYGQRAVARVTLNRVAVSRFPSTICEVVWQPRQFSWTHDGLSDVPGGNAIEDRAWYIAQQIAQSAIVNDYRSTHDPSGGAIMYHANYVSPFWSDSYDETAWIGNHIFYK